MDHPKGIFSFHKRLPIYGSRLCRSLRGTCIDSVDFVQRLRLEKKLDVHQGCVNTISWDESGSVILSGSDDKKLCITDPFSRKVLATAVSGHRSNIFSAQFLPFCQNNQVVSCSGDGQISYTIIDREDTHGTNMFLCHYGTTYEVLTVPGDPHTFLSCGEDGSVRWFDLRTKTSCTKDRCKSDILINCRRAVTTLAVNPMQPYHLAVGCSDSSVRVFDRRVLGTRAQGSSYSGRGIQAMFCRLCPPHLKKKYSRPTSLNYDMNGEEILVSYSTDYIYLFNLKDEDEKEVEETSAIDSRENRNQQNGREEGDSVNPVKRLRLRGDWSDTGPKARPRSERSDEEEPPPRISIVQRMSEMLSRWLEDTTPQHARHIRDENSHRSEGQTERPRGQQREESSGSQSHEEPRRASEPGSQLQSSDVARSHGGEGEDEGIDERKKSSDEGRMEKAEKETEENKNSNQGEGLSNQESVGNSSKASEPAESGTSQVQSLSTDSHESTLDTASGEKEKDKQTKLVISDDVLVETQRKETPSQRDERDERQTLEGREAQDKKRKKSEEGEVGSGGLKGEQTGLHGKGIANEKKKSKIATDDEKDEESRETLGGRTDKDSKMSDTASGEGHEGEVKTEQSGGDEMQGEEEERSPLEWAKERTDSKGQEEREETVLALKERQEDWNPKDRSTKQFEDQSSRRRKVSVSGIPGTPPAGQGPPEATPSTSSTRDRPPTRAEESVTDLRSRFESGNVRPASRQRPRRISPSRRLPHFRREVLVNTDEMEISDSESDIESDEDLVLRRPRRSSSSADESRDAEATRREGAAASKSSRLKEFFKNSRLRREKEEEEMLRNVKSPKTKMVFKGHRNSRTMIKEATFWGNNHVLSGSDCGHVFIWNRHTGELVMLLEGDKHVVNCIQPHPTDPILATSGIDYDIKIWSPLADTPQVPSDAHEVIRINELMLEETRDTITIPPSFMLRMLASLNHLRTDPRSTGEGPQSDSSDD